MANVLRGDKNMIRYLIASIVLTLSAASVKADQGEVMTWNIGGVERKALVFAPAVETPNEKRPLIFAFHGHGGEMQNTASQMNFQTVWPEAIVVYPQGLDGPGVVHDQAGNAPGWQRYVGDFGDRDLKFFDRMLEALRHKYPVDNQRIYAVGFSNGAYFSYVLWATRSTNLAAIGAVAGAVTGAPLPPIQLTSPLPVMHIVGLMDGSVLLEWQAETIAADRNVNNAPMKDGQPCGDSCVLFPSSSQTPVKALFFNGGHLYPSWASAEFVKFFKTHRRG
jgi:polyhydroxybutyrate depolymerase